MVYIFFLIKDNTMAEAASQQDLKMKYHCLLGENDLKRENRMQIFANQVLKLSQNLRLLKHRSHRTDESSINFLTIITICQHMNTAVMNHPWTPSWKSKYKKGNYDMQIFQMNQ